MKNNKLTPSQVKLKNVLRPIVEGILNEAEPSSKLDSQEVKVIAAYINGLSSTPTIRYSVNDRNVLAITDKINALRMELMEYVKENSDYEYRGKSPFGWKWIKKTK